MIVAAAVQRGRAGGFGALPRRSTLLLEGSTAITDTTPRCGLVGTRRGLEEA